jgi:hypothetical protein
MSLSNQEDNYRFNMPVFLPSYTMESRQVIESDSMQQNLAYPRRLCKCSEQLHGGGGFLKSSTSTRQSKQDMLPHNAIIIQQAIMCILFSNFQTSCRCTGF